MRPRAAMFPYQSEAVACVRERRQVAALLPPGYGKTVITLTALDDLGAWPALVVAPAQVVEADVWGAEARAWEHLHGLAVTPIDGDAPRRLRRLADTSHADVVSYGNLAWLTDHVDVDARYRAIVFDELSKLKSPGSKRSTRMRTRGARVPVRVGLTGNPVGNHLLDLYGELRVIGGPAALGPTFGGYQQRYFQPGAYVDGRPVSWVLQGMVERRAGRGEWVHTDRSRATERAIHQRVAPWCYALPPQPSAGIPPVRVHPIRLPMPPAAERATRELRRQLVTLLDGGVEVEALTAGARAGKLRQIAGGAVYSGEGEEWGPVHDAKVDALDGLLDELQGEPLLVFYWYKHERERIAARLARRGATFADTDSPGWMDAWCARELDVLLAHPQSAGYGLNLQAGGHHVAWYSLPWWELFVQGCGRLARPGQAAPQVVAHVLLCGDVDERIFARLDEKRNTELALVDSVLYDDLL